MEQKIPLAQSKARFKKLFYALIAGICLLTACKKDCKEPDTEEKLINTAIAESGDCFCDPYLNKYSWKGRTVYMRYIKGPTCNGVAMYYNSSGEKIILPNGTTFDEFLAESTFIEELWSCKDPRTTHE